MEFLYGYSTVDNLGRFIYRVKLRAVISFRSKGASPLKSRRTLLSVIGLSFLSSIRVYAQSKSKKSRSKSKNQSSKNITFNVFGYMLGTKVVDWKNVEKYSDSDPKSKEIQRYKYGKVLCYKIKDGNFSSTLKSFNNYVMVQQTTSLAYAIVFEKFASIDNKNDLNQLSDDWSTLFLGLNEKYGSSNGSITEKDLISCWYNLSSGEVKVVLGKRKFLDKGYTLTLSYTINNIETDVSDELSKERDKTKDDYTKEIP